ncbi:MAG TPA: HAD family hydrolase [Thiobacillus sp.]|nr:HAD family hydrolase [Thiobacillus sp.]
MAVSTNLSASHGLLIRDRAAFERARNLQAVVFDKTGTLTEGRFGVSDSITLGDLDESACLRLAAALESQSEHPIAKGILRAAEARGISLPAVSEFRNLTGRGAEAKVEGHDVKAVSPGYLHAEGLSANDPRLEKLAGQGKTLVFLLVDGALAAAFGLADVVLVRSDPRDVAAILGLARATYRKMVQNLLWATGYNAFAIPLAAGVAAPMGLLLTPAMGAVLMSLSTVIVAINARLLDRTGVAVASNVA